MKKAILLYCTITILIAGEFAILHAYDDEKTHPRITEESVKKSKLDEYLLLNLGSQFSEGTDTLIEEKPILEWLTEGSKLEDAPDCRAASHFLNPLKPWDKAGLSDTTETILGAFVVTPKCFILAPFSDKYSIHKYSNVTWATGYTSPISGISDTDNDMDWNAARKS